MRRLKTFLSLPAGEQRLFIAAVLSLPLIVLALRLAGYGRTRSWLVIPLRKDRDVETSAQMLDVARAAARTVRRAADHGPVKANCLPRALLIERVLKMQGIDCVIHFGVQNGPDDLEAHAWVECRGVRIDGETSAPHGFHPLKVPGGSTAGTPGRGDRLAPDRLP